MPRRGSAEAVGRIQSLPRDGSSVDLDETEVGCGCTTVKSPSLADSSIGTRHATAAAAAVDPIDEAPGAVWYVRPATGGQFGPASGEIMRTWIDEGRVGASSLVWRAGWAEWRPAAATFPQLAGCWRSPAVAVCAGASRRSRRAKPFECQRHASGVGCLPVGQVGERSPRRCRSCRRRRSARHRPPLAQAIAGGGDATT